MQSCKCIESPLQTTQLCKWESKSVKINSLICLRFRKAQKHTLHIVHCQWCKCTAGLKRAIEFPSNLCKWLENHKHKIPYLEERTDHWRRPFTAMIVWVTLAATLKSWLKLAWHAYKWLNVMLEEIVFMFLCIVCFGPQNHMWLYF